MENPEVIKQKPSEIQLLALGCSQPETSQLTRVFDTSNLFSCREFLVGENPQVTISNLVAAIKASLEHLLFDHAALTEGKVLLRGPGEQRLSALRCVQREVICQSC